MSDGTTITDDGRIDITEKALDHGVDALAALGIVATAYADAATAMVVGGLVSIALGKRVLNQ